MKERALLSFSEISILYYFSELRGKPGASRGSVWRFGLYHGHTENREFRAWLILHSRVFSLPRTEKSAARLVCNYSTAAVDVWLGFYFIYLLRLGKRNLGWVSELTS